MAPFRLAILLVALTLTAPSAWAGQAARPQPLTPADVNAIVQLVKLEDTRQFDEAVLGRLLESSHREIRRRAVVSVGRIADPRGRALPAGMRGENDADILHKEFKEFVLGFTATEALAPAARDNK